MYNLFDLIEQVLTMVQTNVGECSFKKVNLNSMKIVRKTKALRKIRILSLKRKEAFKIYNFINI